MFLSVVGIAFFAVLHMVLQVLCKVFYPGFAKLSNHDMHEYRMQWNALLHSVFASFFALYCILWTCPGDKDFFNDQECREIPRNSHVWTISFTAGYLLLDTLLIVGVVGV